jgi:hypothetical protein
MIAHVMFAPLARAARRYLDGATVVPIHLFAPVIDVLLQIEYSFNTLISIDLGNVSKVNEVISA